MTDSWDEMRRAKEEQYFAEQNKLALEALKARRGGRKLKSPVSGKEMQEAAILGVIVDRDPDGGIWLDPGELEKLLALAAERSKQQDRGWISAFLSSLKS